MTEVSELRRIYTSEYIAVMLGIYEELARVGIFPPSMNLLQIHYDLAVDTKVEELVVKLYQDELYDGRPGSSPNRLPDYLRNNLSEHLLIPLEVTTSDIEDFFNALNITYIYKDNVGNSPLERVW